MTDSMIIACPSASCSARYKVRARALGEKFQCRLCGVTFILSPTNHVVPENAVHCQRCGKAIADDELSGERDEPCCFGCRTTAVRDPSDPAQQLLQMVQNRHEDQNLRLGPRLAGFQIEMKLGQGGFGAVYLVRNKLNERSALKVMHSGVPVTVAALQRFDREIEVLQQLHHPNIVRIVEDGRGGELFYFTMEYYPGGSVAELMRKCGGKLPLPEALHIAMQVLAALEYAHSQRVEATREDGSTVVVSGVVHRDVKPSNILLSRSDKPWNVVLSDFGLAKAFDIAGLSGITVPGSGGGTPAFVPREQALDLQSVRPISDVWSAAATIYNMITGKFPRDFSSELSAWEVAVQCPIVPIRERDPAIPSRLAQVLDAALADKINQRIQTVTEFRKELQSTA